MFLPRGAELQSRYRIERVLGRGGFGVTYLAHDPQDELMVAIKEFLPLQWTTRRPDQPQVEALPQKGKYFHYGLERFLYEAKALDQFRYHPHIVHLQTCFTENGTAYMVMEYLDGLNLRKYLDTQGGRIPFAEAVQIAMQVMEALKAAHNVRILHRDVSPDNIHLTSSGRVVLLDFGAARYAAGDRSKNLALILKPGYAPEEQYSSQGKQGPWTDEYALAATIYRAITGKTPPEASDRWESDTLKPPSRLGVRIPPSAERILMTALAIKGQYRYPTIDEFQQRLLEALSAPRPEPRAVAVPPEKGTGFMEAAKGFVNRLLKTTGPSPHPVPVLCGISGPFANIVVDLSNKPLILGRDPRESNLVFPSTHRLVSKRHCQIAYDLPNQEFLLIDCGSKNGTFLATGIKIAPDRVYPLRPGDRFYLAKAENLFEVQLSGANRS